MILNELQSKAIVESLGISVAKCYEVRNAAEAVEIANNIGYPAVLKISSQIVIHKSDIGGVRLNINTDEELAKQFEAMQANIRKHDGAASVTIQKMMPEGFDAIIGGVRDKELGAVVMYGGGGIYAQVWNDFSFRLAPVKPFEAEEMLEETKSYKILQGFRGQALEKNRLCAAICAVSGLMSKDESIMEIDLNPVRVYKKQIVCLDARIKIK